MSRAFVNHFPIWFLSRLRAFQIEPPATDDSCSFFSPGMVVKRGARWLNLWMNLISRGNRSLHDDHISSTEVILITPFFPDVFWGRTRSGNFASSPLEWRGLPGGQWCSLLWYFQRILEMFAYHCINLEKKSASIYPTDNSIINPRVSDPEREGHGQATLPLDPSHLQARRACVVSWFPYKNAGRLTVSSSFM